LFVGNLFQQAAMREYWREFPVCDFESVRLELLPKIEITSLAQHDDVVAQERRFCATRDLLKKLDASRNMIEVCGDFAAFSGLGYLLAEASACATQVWMRQGEAARVAGYRRVCAA